MSRDQRTDDNWALLYAQEQSFQRRQPLLVVFCIAKSFLAATKDHFNFMIKGLQEVNKNLQVLQIPFVFLEGEPDQMLPHFIEKVEAGLLVTDFSPLKTAKAWKAQLGKQLSIPFIEVDAHNIVPCREASDKQEYAAYTIRPKIHKKLEGFLVEFPKLEKQTFPLSPNSIEALKSLNANIFNDHSPANPFYPESGQEAAKRHLKKFLTYGLPRYDKRNDPNVNACSGLSPYLNFGQISAQRVALEVLKTDIPAAELLEELIVRRELSDNFCYYNENYDHVNCFPSWARKTLEEHRKDIREYLYSLEELEHAKTHDNLWNAAQIQMVKTGSMHGYLRMYWAKKILEWTPSIEDALSHAITLNDKYQLDGRDPNGYAGIAWSIGGIHDRAWAERHIFGKIRYMAYDGCKRKFDINQYILKMHTL
jgi:deoxyribodipyrimidine photo-lyase